MSDIQKRDEVMNIKKSNNNNKQKYIDAVDHMWLLILSVFSYSIRESSTNKTAQ